MNNYVGELIKSYYAALNGNITYNGQPVNIYNVAVDATDKFHYIQLRPESENDQSNKSSFVTNPIVIMDIMTTHDGAIDAGVVENIDNQVKQLIFPTRNTIGLITTGNFQILNVRADNGNYLDGFDGTRYEYRKIVRFFNRINQQ